MPLPCEWSIITIALFLSTRDRCKREKENLSAQPSKCASGSAISSPQKSALIASRSKTAQEEQSPSPLPLILARSPCNRRCRARVTKRRRRATPQSDGDVVRRRITRRKPVRGEVAGQVERPGQHCGRAVSVVSASPGIEQGKRSSNSPH